MFSSVNSTATPARKKLLPHGLWVMLKITQVVRPAQVDVKPKRSAKRSTIGVAWACLCFYRRCLLFGFFAFRNSLTCKVLKKWSLVYTVMDEDQIYEILEKLEQRINDIEKEINQPIQDVSNKRAVQDASFKSVLR
jgi:hypothetical protein